jgi:hypothetical protein
VDNSRVPADAKSLGKTDVPRRLNERLRTAFIAGAGEQSRRRLGRGLAPEELGRVLRRYPGTYDVWDERESMSLLC